MSLSKADFKATTKRLESLIRKWHVPLGLQKWRVCYSYDDTPPAMDDEEWQRTACTSSKWQYLEASISFNIEACSELNDNELEEVFVHECCHILVAEMHGVVDTEREWSKEQVAHEERVVVQLARAFIDVMDRGCKLSKIKVES